MVTMTPHEFRLFLRRWSRLDWVELGTKVPYADAVQRGRPPLRPQRQGMPARPFIPDGVEEWVADAVYLALQSTVVSLIFTGKHIDVQRTFASLMIEYTFARIHNAFRIKAAGGTDDLGVKWAPLSPVTVRRKSLRRRQPLTPTQKKQWAVLHQQIRAMLSATGRSKAEVDQIATDAAWRRMGRSSMRSSGLPINVMTGRLEKSLRPGKRNGSRYTKPSKDQIAYISPMKR